MVVEVLEEKLKLKKANLLQILFLIKERETLREKNISQIERELMNFQRELFKYKSIPYCMLDVIDKKERHLETKVADLQKQIRDENIKCWEDIARLKKELMAALEEYLSTARRLKIFFSEDTTQLPENHYAWVQLFNSIKK